MVGLLTKDVRSGRLTLSSSKSKAEMQEDRCVPLSRMMTGENAVPLRSQDHALIRSIKSLRYGV